MWYAILLGTGLALGVGLLIWALMERSKRAAAEKKAIDEEVLRKQFEEVANENIAAIARIKLDLDKEKATAALLYKELEKARDLLVKVGNPEAIKEWLRSELGQ